MPQTPDEAIANSNTDAPSDASDDNDIIRVDTQLVTIPVKVSDRKNRFFGGLKKEDFHVFEDDVEQEIAYFSNEEQPFTVALVLDMSYSTKFKIGEIQAAAIAFISQLRDQDKVFVISFARVPHAVRADKRPPEDLTGHQKHKDRAGTSLSTPSIDQNERLTDPGEKAIVPVYRRRRYDQPPGPRYEHKRDAMELDALIYPIRYDTYADGPAMKNGGQLPVCLSRALRHRYSERRSGGNRPEETVGSILFRCRPAGRGSSGSNRGTTQEDYKMPKILTTWRPYGGRATWQYRGQSERFVYRLQRASRIYSSAIPEGRLRRR